MMKNSLSHPWRQDSAIKNAKRETKILLMPPAPEPVSDEELHRIVEAIPAFYSHNVRAEAYE
jgi:hypothetical protein